MIQLQDLREVHRNIVSTLARTSTLEQQNALLNQIRTIDFDILYNQQQLIQHHRDLMTTAFAPFLDYSYVGHAENAVLGQKLMAQGAAGSILIAGGQGTRLQFNGPKGMYPISVTKHKTLFQLFAEKTLAAGKQAGRPLPIAIMTSPLNHTETVRYFEENTFFGLSSSQVYFFTQRMLPLLDEKGQLFLESSDHLAMGPDGNGSFLQAFQSSGICAYWREQNIQHVNFVLIDNPLADPFDAELIGFHASRGNDITIKCIERIDPNEKVGTLVKDGNKIKVIEYTELSDTEKYALDTDGSLKHRCANISLFCFSMNFLASTHAPLPLHLAHKACPYLDRKGKTHHPSQPNAWKFERFVFDLIPLSERVDALLYPRKACFAPLKNHSGADSPLTVKKALQDADIKQITKITGLPPPNRPFELAQDFHYPTFSLLNKWRGRFLPDHDYIENENDLCHEPPIAKIKPVN